MASQPPCAKLGCRLPAVQLATLNVPWTWPGPRTCSLWSPGQSVQGLWAARCPQGLWWQSHMGLLWHMGDSPHPGEGEVPL